MVSSEKDAWVRLGLLGAIPSDSPYSPATAREGAYTTQLKGWLKDHDLLDSNKAKDQPVTLAPEQKLAGLEVIAADLLTGKAPYAQRLPLLRASAEGMGITVRDQELEALLRAARRRRANGGEPDLLSPGDRLNLTPEKWAWDGLILRGTFNLLIALPKVGKTSLALAWLDAWYRNEPTFLDRTLHGPCPPVLIVGTDQGPADWGRMLQEIGWVDAAGTIGGPLLGLAHAGKPLHLDGEGIDRIAEIAQKHPGLIVLIDSLSACIAPLGLKEESPQVVDPILDLMEQVAPHGATVVVIHHASKGRAGEGAAAASRGSTALPAAASQILKLAPASANESDPRRLLTTQGRGGPTQALVIQREGISWGLLGGAEILEQEQSHADAEGKLTDRQFEVLREVRDRWEDLLEKTTAAALVEALGLEGKYPEQVARKTLAALEKKGLLQSFSRIRPGLGGRLYEFWPTDPLGGSRTCAGGLPETLSFGPVGSVGPLSHEDPEQNNTITSLAAEPKDPKDPKGQQTKPPRARGTQKTGLLALPDQAAA
ncbi:MAG: hypothetical protein DCF18_10110 [Cyanobium sp.]|uniref:AAA family ATPase n=1 Tax=Synechococcus sp. CS-1333 TaxID=2848638 RepID=UPI000DBBB2ED|nr:AAA family ATPase [Synechococcus sp. CS-1333]MCT0211151.1 AAA family ATPase [Synechococcus sp. CS-1333]PZV22367.1 MAG: hypothetical protein DCF18_10110 [Cyanobium sp.]